MNIGFRPDAVHTKNRIDGKETIGVLKSLSFPLLEPDIISDNSKYSREYCKAYFKTGNPVKNWLSNVKRKLFKK